MSSYIQSAEKRWPGRRVMGDGRFACFAKDGSGPVYLAVSVQQQLNICLGIDQPIRVDLDFNKMLEKIPDRESPEERRERRRAEKATA